MFMHRSNSVCSDRRRRVSCDEIRQSLIFQSGIRLLCGSRYCWSWKSVSAIAIVPAAAWIAASARPRAGQVLAGVEVRSLVLGAAARAVAAAAARVELALRDRIDIASAVAGARNTRRYDGDALRARWHPASRSAVRVLVNDGRMDMVSKNTICLWYDGTALDAARFYAATFADSAVTAIHRAPGDYPAGKQGDVLTVEFTVMGIPCLGLNGGPIFKHSEAFSFQVATDDQAETDRLWNAIISNGGQESACGWCKDPWGLCWQITPRALTAAITDPDPAAAKRAFEAMMQMRKIDIAAIEAAQRG